MSNEKKNFNLGGSIKKGLAFWGKPICVGLISGGLLLGAKFGVVDPIVYRAYKNDLPTFEDANENLDATGYNTDITWYENKRFVFPSSGKVKVNVHIPEEQQTDRFKLALEDSINEINEVLQMINPKYNLEINYDPGLFDKLYCFNLYSCDLSADKTEKSRTVGNATTKYNYDTKNGEGKYVVDVDIDLDYCESSCESDEKYLNFVKYVLCHEIAGHGLASMKDAYDMEYYSYQTIMESANAYGVYFSKSDLMIMFSLYSQNANYSEWEQKIDNYLASKPFYINLESALDYVKENFYNEYVVKNGLQDYISPEDIQYDNIGDVYIKSISNRVSYLEKGNLYIKDITYKGLTSTCKIENLQSIASRENILFYKTNYDFYTHGGGSFEVIYDHFKSVYVKIGDKTIVEVCLKDYYNGGFIINNFKTYDLISKEEYQKEVTAIEEVIKQINKNTGAGDLANNDIGLVYDIDVGCVKFIQDFLNENGCKYKKISGVKNEMHGAIYDSSTDAKPVVITDEFIYIDNEKLYYSIKDGFMFCSNGKVLALLDNNSVIELEFGIDYDNAKIKVEESGKLLFVRGPQFKTNEKTIDTNENAIEKGE